MDVSLAAETMLLTTGVSDTSRAVANTYHNNQRGRDNMTISSNGVLDLRRNDYDFGWGFDLSGVPMTAMQIWKIRQRDLGWGDWGDYLILRPIAELEWSIGCDSCRSTRSIHPAALHSHSVCFHQRRLSSPPRRPLRGPDRLAEPTLRPYRPFRLA